MSVHEFVGVLGSVMAPQEAVEVYAGWCFPCQPLYTFLDFTLESRKEYLPMQCKYAPVYTPTTVSVRHPQKGGVSKQNNFVFVIQ